MSCPSEKVLSREGRSLTTALRALDTTRAMINFDRIGRDEKPAKTE
jgi:hypothetical protein